MRRRTFILPLIILAACQTPQATPFSATLASGQTGLVASQTPTPVPTARPIASRTPTPLPSDTPTVTPTYTVTHTPTITQTPTDTFTPSVTPTPEKVDHYVLERPIARDLVDWIDRTYPYGWTQYGGRPIHLGVDFANPRLAAVLAAGDGTITFAGRDTETQFGPQKDYYGNLVVIEHEFLSPEGLPVFTLYGHLERVEVATRQTVQQKDMVGTIGDSGVAIGPHLHFEVRVGDAYDFHDTRNPDLWIRPYPAFGTLAGRMINRRGDLEHGRVIQIRSETETLYTFTYADDIVNSDPLWRENFTRGDLPQGQYDVIVSDRSGRVYFQQTITIKSGLTTWIDVMADQ